jgi:hypothetical protein
MTRGEGAPPLARTDSPSQDRSTSPRKKAAAGKSKRQGAASPRATSRARGAAAKAKKPAARKRDPTPSAERPPHGLDAYWLGVWRHGLKTLKAQGTWAWEQKPLLDEYVFALRAAEATRKGFGWLKALEEYAENADELPDIAWSVLGKIAGGLPTQWDRHVKRASMLADQLALTDRGRKAIDLVDDDDETKPEGFDALDGDGTADNVTPITRAATRR